MRVDGWDPGHLRIDLDRGWTPLQHYKRGVEGHRYPKGEQVREMGRSPVSVDHNTSPGLNFNKVSDLVGYITLHASNQNIPSALCRAKYYVSGDLIVDAVNP